MPEAAAYELDNLIGYTLRSICFEIQFQPSSCGFPHSKFGLSKSHIGEW